jgi:hypothetical protein
MSRNQGIKQRKLNALLITLLLVSAFASVAIVAASNDNGGGSEQGQQAQTGNSTSAMSTMNQNQNTTNSGGNQTNVFNSTAATERQQIQARQQTQLQVRNMTMLMNCTNNCEVVLSSDEDVAPQNFQLSLDANQTMKLEMNLSKSPLNGAMVNERTLNFYLGIEPNATMQLHAQIRLRINQTELSQSLNREVNASRLTWMYWNQTTAQWEKVESHMDQNGYLVCDTDHFSTWTVAEVEPVQEPTTQSTQSSGIPMEYFVIGTVAALAVVAVGIIAYKKRK